MPEKSGTGGWRKRIHARPSGNKAKAEQRALADEDTQSLLSLSERASWSGSFHSRPGTPARTPTPTFLQPDTDDVRHEITMDRPSPRKPTKPNLARYISGYRSIMEASKEQDFADPWSEISPPYEEVVDPLVTLQSVFAHMNTLPARPIPIHYNSGIFRIFADYRIVREEKERLNKLCNDTFASYRDLETYYEDQVAEYVEEIRRLELLIAHGTSGMAGLMRARQDTVVKRGRTHRRTMAKHDAPMSLDNIPTNQLDEQIRLRSQQVLARKPGSPSGRMAILSRQFDQVQDNSNFTVGTPPSRDGNTTLSRKMQSELNLQQLGKAGGDNLVPRSIETIESGFSGKGDPLPDEEEPRPTIVVSAIDLEAFVALQELGTLVARKKGLDTKRFLAGLMQLYSMPPNEPPSEPEHEASAAGSYASHSEDSTGIAETQSISERTALENPSQSQLGSAQKIQRHFSFEPGDDQIAAIEHKLKLQESDDSSNSDDVETTNSPCLTPTLTTEPQKKPSKIPSPAQRPFHNKCPREGSESSVRVASRTLDGDNRRDSSSSVLTAIRHNSNDGSSRPTIQNRKSSGGTRRRIESNQTDSMGKRHNIAAIAAAKAVDQADGSSTRNGMVHPGSAASNVRSYARINRPSENAHAENALPHQRL